MENDVLQRIRMILETTKSSMNAISKHGGMKQNTFSRQISGENILSVKSLLSILGYFPNVSAEWLLRGKGSMFLSDNQSVDESIVDHLNHRITWLEAQNALLREQAGLPSEKREGA